MRNCIIWKGEKQKEIDGHHGTAVDWGTSCLEVVDPEGQRRFMDFLLFKSFEGYPISVITMTFALLALYPPCLLLLSWAYLIQPFCVRLRPPIPMCSLSLAGRWTFGIKADSTFLMPTEMKPHYKKEAGYSYQKPLPITNACTCH